MITIEAFGDELGVHPDDVRALLVWVGHPIPDDEVITAEAMDDLRNMLDGPTCERSVWWAWRDFSLDDELFYLDMEEQGILVRPGRPGTAGQPKP